MSQFVISLRFTGLFLLASFGLIACGSYNNYAPVSNAQYQSSINKGIHIVRRGETLYAIAWLYDLDYRELAKYNGLRSPYRLPIGQRLYIRFKSRNTIKSAHKKHPIIRRNKKHRLNSREEKQKRHYQAIRHWRWPAKPKVIKQFSLAKRSKGIDIVGYAGEPIRATAAGRVAYSGNGLPGYGNLLIIKHNDEYLSAYAHNQQLLVKEGAWVKAGQVIARMGKTGSRRVMLHFEIRKAGRPVNPLHYLRHS